MLLRRSVTEAEKATAKKIGVPFLTVVHGILNSMAHMWGNLTAGRFPHSLVFRDLSAGGRRRLFRDGSAGTRGVTFGIGRPAPKHPSCLLRLAQTVSTQDISPLVSQHIITGITAYHH